MTRGRPSTLSLWIPLAVALALLGCAPPAPAPLPAPVDLEGVSDDPVAGAVAGQRFEVRDARVRIETREGRERVDLFLWDRPIERCGLPLAREGALLWLRLPGRTALEVGEAALAGEDDEGLELHYERLEGGELVVRHRGVARLRIDAVEPGRTRGVLRACFADATPSCVEGRFDAAPCLSRIDGRALREPPGLADDALEPTGEAPGAP